jgi:hypothetical protein
LREKGVLNSMKFNALPLSWQVRIEQAIDAASDDLVLPVEIDREEDGLIVGCTYIGDVDKVSEEYNVSVDANESFSAKRR